MSRHAAKLLTGGSSRAGLSSPNAGRSNSAGGLSARVMEREKNCLPGWMRTLAIQAGVLLVMLCTIEISAKIYLRFFGPSGGDQRQFADAYADRKWAREYWTEYNRVEVTWHPYSYWVGAPYTGRFINITHQGLRATTPPSRLGCSRPSQIFVFGGSAMWGEGSDDNTTIASWLERMLQARGYCVEVSNYAQDGYVSTQDRMALEEQLLKGNIPDVAVFYSGYNDIADALFNGRAGETFDEQMRRLEFNIANRFHGRSMARLLLVAAPVAILNTGVGMIARRIFIHLHPDEYGEIYGQLVRFRVTAASGSPEVQRLEDLALQVYLGNRRLIEATAHEYGFRALFYWQPWILDKSPLSPYERRCAAPGTFMPSEMGFIGDVYRKVSAMESQKQIRYVGNVFSHRPEPYFVDHVHMSADGNRRVAEFMLPDVIQAITSKTSRSLIDNMKKGPSSVVQR